MSLQIDLSVLSFYNRDLTTRFLMPFLELLDRQLVQHPEWQVALHFTNNAPDEDLSDLQAHAQERVARTPRLTLHWYQSEQNLGFGAAHNRIFERTRGSFFFVVNNDLFIEDPAWLDQMLQPFKDPEVALVGLENAPRILKDDGNGWYAETPQAPGDYAEGSLLAVRRSAMNGSVLFSPDLPVAYYEDSDLSLRVRQAGGKIAYVTIAHDHQRSSSAQRIPVALKNAISEANRGRFLSRWAGYLRNRKLHNRVLIELVSAGWGDVVLAIPALARLSAENPRLQIEILTNQKSLMPFMRFPNTEVRYVSAFGMGAVQVDRYQGKYDRVFTLRELDYSSPLYLGESIAQAIGVDWDIETGERHLRKVIESMAPFSPELGLDTSRPLALVHGEYLREDWEGRGVPVEVFQPLIDTARARGFQVALIGSADAPGAYRRLGTLCDLDLCGKFGLDGLAQLMTRASLFIGIDSGPIHLAQLFNVPTFGLFGATLPSARLCRWERTTAFMKWDLGCLGCYHRLTEPSYNYCIRRDQACVRQLSGVDAAQGLEVFLAGSTGRMPVGILIAEQRVIQAREQRKRAALVEQKTSELARPIEIADRFKFHEIRSALWLKTWRRVRFEFQNRLR